MSDTKRFYVLFSFYDRSSIQSYLEKKAQQGWMLEKASAFGWKFRRIEPKKLHFAVTYFPNASSFDPEPSEQQLTFQDFCEHTGWRLVASNAQMQIYCNEAENPIPIETDPEIEIENIHTSVKKSIMPSYVMQAVNGFLQILLFLQRFSNDPLGILGSNLQLVNLLLWIVLEVLIFVDMGCYLRWYRKAKAAAADGDFLPTPRTTNFQAVILAITIIALGCLLLSFNNAGMIWVFAGSVATIFAITAITLGCTALMKRWKFEAKTNRNVSIVLTVVLSLVFMGIFFSIIISSDVLSSEKAPAAEYEYNGWTYSIYDDEVPLRIEELADTDHDGYSRLLYEDNSIFLSRQEATQRPRKDAMDEPELAYVIVDVKFSPFYDWCLDLMLDDLGHNYGYPIPEEKDWEQHIEVDASPWGAEKAWQLWVGGEPEERYLLCYENRIVEIDFDWPVTEAQMEIIGQILGK